MDVEEQAHWLLLTFKSGLSHQTVNSIVQTWCLQQRRTLKDFFAATSQEWMNICRLNEKTLVRLEQAKSHVAEQQEVAARLTTNAIDIITVLDARYPGILKATLSSVHLPPVLFSLGNLQLLERVTIAIIGSRKAGELSLAFTHASACYLATHGTNVISGYARGVDRAAYDGAMSANGCTTVVLPHGINGLSKVQMTDLKPKIECGNVLLLSQFHPDAVWLVSRAMARNKVVTGLAQIVIVAETTTQGGTWDAANGALAQKRPLYVCQAVDDELLSGNSALIERGGRSLYWSREEAKGRSIMDIALSPLLDESNRLRQRQEHTPKLSHQLFRLLKEHGINS